MTRWEERARSHLQVRAVGHPELAPQEAVLLHGLLVRLSPLVEALHGREDFAVLLAQRRLDEVEEVEGVKNLKEELQERGQR